MSALELLRSLLEKAQSLVNSDLPWSVYPKTLITPKIIKLIFRRTSKFPSLFSPYYSQKNLQRTCLIERLILGSDCGPPQAATDIK